MDSSVFVAWNVASKSGLGGDNRLVKDGLLVSWLLVSKQRDANNSLMDLSLGGFWTSSR